MYILLAEDNPGDVLLVKRALDEHGLAYELHVVRDGGEALAYLERIGVDQGNPCPDLLVLDLNLPKVSGPAILEEFRRHPECSKTPVIAFTSSDAERDRAEMSRMGADRYFRKPLELADFLTLGAIVREVTATA